MQEIIVRLSVSVGAALFYYGDTGESSRSQSFITSGPRGRHPRLRTPTYFLALTTWDEQIVALHLNYVAGHQKNTLMRN